MNIVPPENNLCMVGLRGGVLLILKCLPEADRNSNNSLYNGKENFIGLRELSCLFRNSVFYYESINGEEINL